MFDIKIPDLHAVIQSTEYRTFEFNCRIFGNKILVRKCWNQLS